MDWCRREWKAGLGFLAETYNFRVRPFDEGPGGRPPGLRDPDYCAGPSGHALSFRARILWLNTGDAHAEWLHEAAHLVCAPPWEKSPNEADEYGGIFGWERAVAREFRRTGRWTGKDFQKFEDVQGIYGTGEVPKCWGIGGYGEWESVPRHYQRIVLRFIRKTLRMARLLDARNRPTWKEPVWSDAIRLRWHSTASFKTAWPVIQGG